MNFKEIFPNYESFVVKGNHNEVTNGLVRDICRIFPDSILLRARNYKGKGRLAVDRYLIDLCNIASKYTSTDTTTNWGWDFLINDYDTITENFLNKKLHKFMDFISTAYFDVSDDSSIFEINEILEEHDVIYRLVNNREKPWVLAQENKVESIEDVYIKFREISEQALEHIKQAKIQLQNSENNRSRKDALRDCLSATETIIKKVTGQDSYEKAAETFRLDEEKWGPKYIVADCIIIWKRYHQNYPDVRHGDDEITDLSIEETLYSIDRLLAFNMYIIRKFEKFKELGE